MGGLIGAVAGICDGRPPYPEEADQDHGREEFERNYRGRRRSMVQFFSLGSILVLVALAASMVLLPLMLPPLPPPPLVLLFFPVGIMAALMLLAFSPADAGAGGNVVV
ncbi:putative transmembrane protein [Senna tora]|uniref:Putative transmembrane protein n=1 Tax=Senna tora TaxID=362788 RepID=A0A835CCH9_9FABA|nr:putative transmembrane protein [Senna tora]